MRLKFEIDFDKNSKLNFYQVVGLVFGIHIFLFKPVFGIKIFVIFISYLGKRVIQLIFNALFAIMQLRLWRLRGALDINIFSSFPHFDMHTILAGNNCEFIWRTVLHWKVYIMGIFL